ncbi:MAG: hypothetical protein Q8O03_01835 [Nanoarchaeota archaeon]|nr:hypothetical protein [Nanoarchaeota archaeon]
MQKKSRLLLVIGLIISVTSISLAFLKINYWYFPAVIGVWFVFDYLASYKSKHTTIQILKENKKKFFQLYLMIFFLGCSFELIGRFILGWWAYPSINTIFLEILLMLFYPFILFSFREMYNTLSIIIKSRIITFVFSMLLGIIIWEIPNMFSKDWVYTVPYLNFEILNLQVVIVIGWSALIGFPLIVYSVVLQEDSGK